MVDPTPLLSPYSGCERRVGVWAVNPGAPCPQVVGPDGRPWHGAERIEELLVEQLAVVLTGAVLIR